MPIPSVTSAVEGGLDEAVAFRLIAEAGGLPGRVIGKRGRPHLLQNLCGYNAAAGYSRWLVLLDLDRTFECAPSAAQDWLPNPAPQMCFCICVQEVEAWLLADRTHIATFLGVSQALVPRDPEALADPKQALVNLARRSRKRSIREGLVPSASSGRTEGKTYSSDLSSFARNSWDVVDASARCASLDRALRRLRGIVGAAGGAAS